jgi:hypothetical protein
LKKNDNLFKNYKRKTFFLNCKVFIHLKGDHRGYSQLIILHLN